MTTALKEDPLESRAVTKNKETVTLMLPLEEEVRVAEKKNKKKRSHLRTKDEDIALRSTRQRIESLSVTFHGHDLIVDSEMELNYGRRYGLLGLNVCGKSTILTAIGKKGASYSGYLPSVINCDDERLKLEKEAERLAEQDDGGGEALDRGNAGSWTTEEETALKEGVQKHGK
ncbi:hypothetical protein C5167_012010 [Papaver somniferum]|uniref:HTH myb-type domain-containing protein n=1 Tax=Papaver somniferum TaxID=3469 RepID=A0A4Y7IY99_PAPSO|nr:hypothetical protein C5167_012010 [Papaver somniferum]